MRNGFRIIAGTSGLAWPNLTLTPVVPIPGMMCDARMWGGLSAVLHPRKVGHALPVGSNRIDQLAAALLRDAPPRFALAGLSMGGIVAMEVVRQAPGRVERLALMDTNPLADTPELQSAVHCRLRGFLQAVWPRCCGTR